MNDDNFVMKSRTAHPFLRILSYGKPYIGWFALALAIIVATTFIELYQPVILGDAVDASSANTKTRVRTGFRSPR